MILKALRAWLDRRGGRDLDPWDSREALAPLEHFWRDGGPLETADRLDPSSGPGRRVPRGHIQKAFKDMAKREGLLFALECLARFLAPPAMRRYGPSFIPHLTGLIALGARAQSPEAEADFQRFMWEATGDFTFFRDYGQAFLRHGRPEEFEAALDQALTGAESPGLTLALMELQSAGGDWERTAGHLDRSEARYPALAGSGRFKLLRGRAELSLAPRGPQPMADFAAYRLTLDPHSPACRYSAAQTDRIGLSALPFRGVEGRRLPPALLAHLGEGENAPGRRPEDRGHLGCSLSHLALWEHFLDDGRPFALVLEEDAVPYYRFDLRTLQPFLDQGRELVYVHDRRSWINLPENIVNFGAGRPPDLEVSDLFRADYEAYGAYGYVLSRRGAEKLLEAHRRDGLRDYLDAQMPAYSLAAPAPHPHWWKQRVNALRRRLDEKGGGLYLDAVCLALPLVFENGLFASGTSPARSYETPNFEGYGDE